MGSGMPEIGSRISLISKADIRYEGKLYTVDPEECTIALSSVRSYGTEDREAPHPIPAQNQVYDYILFRGTDIKDIRVLSTTIPNDPAIVKLSVPPSLNDSQFPSRTGYPQSPMPPMSMPNAPGTSRDQSQSFPSSFAGAVSSRTNASDMNSKSHSTQNVASEDDSRSSTPSTHHTKSNDANTRVSVSLSAEESSTKKLNSNYSRDRQQGGNRYQQAPRQQYQRYQPQPRYQNHQSQQQQSEPRYAQQQQSHYRDYNRDNQYRNYNDYRDSYAPRQYMQPMRNQQRGDGWNNYEQRNNRNRMGQNAQPRINYQSTGYQNQNRKPKNTLKFEGDYDFEEANSKFEVLRTQLEKTKLHDGPSDPPIKMNGDVDSKKEDSGNEAASGGEENDVESEDKPIFYDKVKSFFDGISYESIERSKGLTTRVDWKTERKINSETFGMMALRRNNPNFRGRVGQNGGNYYNNQNRNSNMMNNYHRVRYNQPQQHQQQKPMNQQRRTFNTSNKPQGNGDARST